MKSQLYKELYDYELITREKYITASQVPILLLTALAGAIGYAVSTVLKFSSLYMFFGIALLVLSVALFCIASCYLYRTVKHYDYERLPHAKTLQAYVVDSLMPWAEEQVGHLKEKDIDISAEELADIELEKYVNTLFADIAETNAELNDARSRCLSKSIQYIWITFISVFLLLLYIAIGTTLGMENVMEIKLNIA